MVFETMLKDKVAIVTGGAAGIGRGILDLFAQQGARLFVLDSNGPGVKAACSEIEASRAFARPFTGDVRRKEDIGHVVDAAMREFRRIDILINNAGIYP